APPASTRFPLRGRPLSRPPISTEQTGEWMAAPRARGVARPHSSAPPPPDLSRPLHSLSRPSPPRPPLPEDFFPRRGRTSKQAFERSAPSAEKNLLRGGGPNREDCPGTGCRLGAIKEKHAGHRP